MVIRDLGDIEVPEAIAVVGGGGQGGFEGLLVNTTESKKKSNNDDNNNNAAKTTPNEDASDDPLATTMEVFSFMPNRRTKVYFAFGVVCAAISGCIFPALAFLFSNSFSDLSGPVTDDGDSYLATIRELAYSFMVLG